MKSKMWFLVFFLGSSLCAYEFSETSVPEMRFDFQAGKLASLFPQDFKHPSQASSKMYPEFSKFKPARSWDLNYTDKQRALQVKAQKDKEFVQLLRGLDSTRKTEYFRKVLRSPLPESFKGDPKYNPELKAILFSFE